MVPHHRCFYIRICQCLPGVGVDISRHIIRQVDDVDTMPDEGLDEAVLSVAEFWTVMKGVGIKANLGTKQNIEGWHTLDVLIFLSIHFQRLMFPHNVPVGQLPHGRYDMRIKANRLPRRPRPWNHRHCQYLKKQDKPGRSLHTLDVIKLFSLFVWVSNMFKDTLIACDDRHGAASRGWVRNPWLVGWCPSTELCDDCDGQTPVPSAACGVRSETRI